MTRQRHNFHPNIDVLEDRNLMSVTSVALTAGVLTVKTDNYDSNVHVSQSGRKMVVEDNAPHGFYLTTPQWAYDTNKVTINKIVFIGGRGNDTFVNDAPVPIEAYGDDGNDFLQGNKLALDQLFGGTGVNTYRESFNPDHWFVNGYTAADVDQAHSPTCTFLGALASAADRVDLSSDINETARGVYQIRLVDKGRFVYQTIRFDGTWTDNDAQPGHDRDSTGQLTARLNGEFWTLLYQRAYLQLKGVNWNDLNTGHWGTSWKDGQAALYAITGWTCSTTNVASNQSTAMARNLQADLQRGDVLTAGTGSITSNNVVGKHLYAIESVYQAGGVWMVKLYNPWGHDGPEAATDGRDDGFITLTWSQFRTNFNQVYRGH